MAINVNGAMVRDKIVKDVVHQYVSLPTDFFETCIDTKLFQRLRRVKQLSLTHYVYPGAVHTRFEHSLGVAYTMRRSLYSIIDNMKKRVIPAIRSINSGSNPELRVLEEFLISLIDSLKDIEGEAVTAALIHDIGHLALSHTFEEGLRDYILTRTGGPVKLPLPDWDHEALTLHIAHQLACAYETYVALVETSRKKRSKGPGRVPGECPDFKNNSINCLKGVVCYKGRLVNLNLVAEILELAYRRGEEAKEIWNEYCRPYSTSIILDKLEYKIQGDDIREAARKAAICVVASLLNHNIDVDRADYILRDSIHTGSLYGVYDLNRLYTMITVVPRIIGVEARGGRPKTNISIEINLGVLRKGVSVVESMLLSRVYMYSEVYLHDISMIYSGMASRLIALLLIARHAIARDLETGGERAKRAIKLLEKYPFLKGLHGYLGFSEFRCFEERDTIEERLHNTAEILSLLSDPFFEEIVFRIASGAAKDLLLYLKNYPDEAKDVFEDKTLDWYREWFRDICVSMSLLAQGLWERRHWSAFLMEESDKTASIIELVRERASPVMKEFQNYMTPLIMVSWAVQSPYKSDSRRRILVFRSHNPLVPVEISKASNARVVRSIKSEVFRKFLIIYPKIPRFNGVLQGTAEESPGKDWLIRHGKGPTRVHIKNTAQQCELENNVVWNILRMASDNARVLATTLADNVA